MVVIKILFFIFVIIIFPIIIVYGLSQSASGVSLNIKNDFSIPPEDFYRED